jgi:3-oxoacyl-[acyl-carrier protein] reductase
MASVQAASAATLAHFGRIDGLVNNAGIVADAQLRKMSEAQWDRVIDVNLKGVFNCSRATVEALVERGGAIVNMSSIVGLSGNFGQTNYAAAKAGVLAMTKTWARELGRKGVRCNAVCPGFIGTAIVKDIPQHLLDDMVGEIPQGRMGRPDEVAACVVFLLSDQASYVNGATLEVSGGLTL